MKKVLTIVFAAIAGGSVYAVPVAESVARLAGKNFMTKYVQAKDAEPVLVKTYQDHSGSNAAFYVYSVNSGQGFVIVSGDDAVRPILGYSSDNAFPINNISPEVTYWLEYYNNQISDVIAARKTASGEIAQKWELLLSGSYGKTAGRGTAVSPLVATKWDQGTYYNELCPGTGSSKAPTGCVATAMAQIMKYWNAPTEGTGSYSYTHGTYGALSADFGSTTYDWGVMPVTLNSSSSDESVDAVATLMFHCGVAVKMDYSPEGSGSQVIGWGSYPSALNAFKNYFGYKTTISGEYREDYTTDDWITMLKDEIDAGRPVLYAGFDLSFGAGHAFVFSGYDDDDMFHINWGWSGYYNGYFTVDDLNPDGTGIGGGSGTYNDGQQVLINIEPIGESAMFSIALNSTVTSSASTIAYNSPFNIEVTIGNTGTMDFWGKLSANIYRRSDSSFVGYVAYLSDQVLEKENETSIVFSTEGKSSMTPGDYFIQVYYKVGTESVWTLFPDNGSFINRSDITVISGTTSMDNNVAGIAEDILLYPNPATDYLNIDLSKAGKVNGIAVFNTIGQKVYITEQVASLTRVPVSNLAPGLYFVHISTEKGNVIKQVVIR